MEYDELRRKELTHVCAECGGLLTTIWDSENNCHRLVCRTDQTHNGIQAKLTPAQAVKRGKADEVIGSGAQKDLEERATKNQLAWQYLPKDDFGSAKALTVAQVEGLVKWAKMVGLNAYLGHVCLFHGEPYPSIDGYYYLNYKRKEPYQIECKPMTREEKIAYMIETDAYAAIARACLGGQCLPDTGVGYISKEEYEAKSERNPEHWRSPIVHDKPHLMVEKRAIWQLLRKLIPLEEHD